MPLDDPSMVYQVAGQSMDAHADAMRVDSDAFFDSVQASGQHRVQQQHLTVIPRSQDPSCGGQFSDPSLAIRPNSSRGDLRNPSGPHLGAPWASTQYHPPAPPPPSEQPPTTWSQVNRLSQTRFKKLKRELGLETHAGTKAALTDLICEKLGIKKLKLSPSQKQDRRNSKQTLPQRAAAKPSPKKVVARQEAPSKAGEKRARVVSDDDDSSSEEEDEDGSGKEGDDDDESDNDAAVESGNSMEVDEIQEDDVVEAMEVMKLGGMEFFGADPVTRENLTEAELARLDLMARSDATISGARRLGSSSTEACVVKEISAWVYRALKSPAHPAIVDNVVDEAIFCAFMAEVSERALKTKSGKSRLGTDRLSGSMLRKLSVGLGAVRRYQDAVRPELVGTRPLRIERTTKLLDTLCRQANAALHSNAAIDVTKGTPLEGGKWGDKEHALLTRAILSRSKQVPTMLRSILIISTGLVTMARGNTIAEWQVPNALADTLQFDATGLDIDGILAIFKTGKKVSKSTTGKKGVNFIPNHINPLLDARSFLAIFREWQWSETGFDLVKVITEQGSKPFDWLDDSTFREAYLLSTTNSAVFHGPGTSVLSAAWKKAFEWSGQVSDKATHHGRGKLPKIISGRGCPDSDTAVTGGWATDVFSQVYHDPTPAKAVLTLAGFKVDDDYVVPRININVPSRFTDLIHPFLGPVETLEGLSRGTAILRQTLRGERRQGYASIRQVCKDSVVFKKLHLFKGTKGKDLLDWCDEVYPRLVAEATKAAFSTDRVYKQVADKQIRSIYRHQGAQISHMQESLELIKGRTALFSPSKMSAPTLSSFTAAASFVLPSAGGSALGSAISLVNTSSAAQNIIRNAPSIFSNPPPPSSPPPRP
ncbi:hypothetical protein P7C70_g6624, partial [Phenoliferia sp. Uapishka_3]